MPLHCIDDYTLVSEESDSLSEAHTDLLNGVRTLMGRGWVPLGPVQSSVSTSEEWITFLLTQTLVKYKET